MKTWEEIKTSLATPLDKNIVAFRKADWGNSQVPYLEHEYVVRSLNGVFGEDGWSEENAECSFHLYERDEMVKGQSVHFYIAVATARETLVLSGLAVNMEDVDAGDSGVRSIRHTGEGVCSNKATRPESAIETAMKGAATDALKRAAMKLGDPFGLSLYNKEYRDELQGRESSRPAHDDRQPPPEAYDNDLDAALAEDNSEPPEIKCPNNPSHKVYFTDREGKPKVFKSGKKAGKRFATCGTCKDGGYPLRVWEQE